MLLKQVSLTITEGPIVCSGREPWILRTVSTHSDISPTFLRRMRTRKLRRSEVSCHCLAAAGMLLTEQTRQIGTHLESIQIQVHLGTPQARTTRRRVYTCQPDPTNNLHILDQHPSPVRPYRAHSRSRRKQYTSNICDQLSRTNTLVVHVRLRT